ncbi:hypothetical protein BC833DRAFT_562536 [Globomyces pollinis-pini]|nr:hypothetical protein BC833DRAFT_562536 [Globomyces pollinis-pini]KAJ2994802.1 hypothetical protein HDV02_001301 [Globomyces sp. JEL0801]
MIFSIPSILALFAIAQASPVDNIDLSPNTIYTESCQNAGGIKVCAQNKEKGVKKLSISYPKDGSLWAKASPISAWVKLNGIDVTTPNFYGASDSRGGAVNYAYYTLGNIKNLQLCYRATTKDDPTYTYQWYSRCPVTPKFPLLEGPKEGGKVDWYYDGQFEENLFYAAGVTAWNVEIAFKNEKGDWDSVFGKNYKFVF